MYVSIASIWDCRCCDRVAMSQTTSRPKTTRGRAAREQITKYCCFLQNPEGTSHGCGFIIKIKDVELFAPDWKKRRKIRELETDYALITSHDTIPGLSPTDLNGWKVSCECIANGNEPTLNNLVCGVISCCGPETLFAGHSLDAIVFCSHHRNAGCDIQLNITILFLTKHFEDLLQGSPPVIPVKVYLDQESYTQKYKQIINTGGELEVYYCDKTRSVKSTVVSLAERQGTSEQSAAAVSVEQQTTSVHERALSKEIIEFERLQKLVLHSTTEIGHGCPVVYLNPVTNEPSIIGVYVGKTKQRGQDIVVTFHGILRLLQGGLIPVLSALQCLDIPQAWVSRWGYLVTPYIDQMKMKSDYLCEVLDFLLKKRHGTPLVKLPVDLVEVDNEASLDLLCALFKHFKSADSADLNEAVTKLNLRNEINAYITRLCKNVIHLLELGDSMVADRTSLVKKCCIFYNLLLNIKFTETTKQVLCTFQNLELLKRILKRYKHSDVQENVIDIILKSLDRHPLSVEELLTLADQILPQEVIDSLRMSASVNVQETFEKVKELLHQQKTVSTLKRLLNSGYPLSDKEVRDLIDQILPQDVIDSLEKSGLDLKTSGNVQTTLNEARRLLHQHENVSSLRQFLNSELKSNHPNLDDLYDPILDESDCVLSHPKLEVLYNPLLDDSEHACKSSKVMENESHYEAYKQALKEEVGIPLTFLKVLFFGPPRTGKTSMRRRLVREILNLANEPVQPSTGTAEHYDVIVKVGEDKITTWTTVITKSEWSTAKALFGKQKNTHETDLDEELRLLYQFVYENASPVEKKSPEKRMADKATKEESLAVQAKSIVGTNTAPSAIQDEAPKTNKDNSNTSIDQEALPSGEPEYGLTVKEKEEIENAYEAFTKVMCAPGQEQLKVLLEETVLMNMVDTGGHPAFLEMLPALTMGPALYLIFFGLDQELKKSYKIWYVSEDKESVQVGESSYTVEEVIFQALSSIACFSCTAPMKANMPNPSHAAVLVGTHKDLLGSDPELVATEIKAKDGALQKNLQEILDTDLGKSHKNFLHHASDDQLMFAINNMTGGEEELKEVRKRLEDIIKQEFDDFLIPASWLMFSIFLRKMRKRTLSLSQCRMIGDRLKVRDTDEALWFLHHCVGILMHFPEVEEIKDVVICDPQVVFDSVTDLILKSFNLKWVSRSVCENFEKTGQFSFKDIQKIARNLKSDHLPLPKLVKLLEHLYIIAPIKPGSSSPESDACQEVFFMPAVLKHATEEELHMKQSPTDPVPLMIHFKCGFVPVGVFCATIATLVAQADTLGWILYNKGGHIWCKNKVTFRIDGTYDIIMISKPKWYEIHITHISTTPGALEEICQHVLETVCDTLDQVIFKMKYKQNLISSRSDQTLYELGFKCPNHPDDNHLVINRPKSRVQAPSQSAKSLWFYYLKKKSVMICLKEEISVDHKDISLSPPFAQQSLVWFGETTEISQASIPDPENQSADIGADIIEASGSSDLDAVPIYCKENGLELNVKNVINVLREAGFAFGHWEKLGQQLIENATLSTIRANRHGDSHLCMSDTISGWLNNDLDKSWEKLAEAVAKLEEYGQATADCVLRKAGIVHQCTAVTPEKQRVSYLSPPTSTVDRQSGRSSQERKRKRTDLESDPNNMAPSPKRNPPTAEESPAEEPQVELTIEDLCEITDYLLHLEHSDIYNLGLILGLFYSRLIKMEVSERFRDDMIAAWLQKEDQVIKKGVPTWETLAKALRHPRVNQTRVAEKIETEKLNITK